MTITQQNTEFSLTVAEPEVKAVVVERCETGKAMFQQLRDDVKPTHTVDEFLVAFGKHHMEYFRHRKTCIFCDNFDARFRIRPTEES